jgi:hypothetical protein
MSYKLSGDIPMYITFKEVTGGGYALISVFVKVLVLHLMKLNSCSGNNHSALSITLSCDIMEF